MLREMCIKKKIWGVKVTYFNAEGEQVKTYNSSIEPTKKSVQRVLREHFKESEFIIRNIEYDYSCCYLNIPQESVYYGQDIESEAKYMIKEMEEEPNE